MTILTVVLAKFLRGWSPTTAKCLVVRVRDDETRESARLVVLHIEIGV